MTIPLLIDAIVRQITVLIAQLATAGGVRAPLSHVANQVFLDLATELDAQGVSRKVSADMFGMALRAYVRKVQRLGESSTERGRTLREAVYDYLSSRPVVTREQIMERFRHDEEELVRGVLHDLAESGLVFVTGAGLGMAYRVASAEELGHLRDLAEGPLDELVWALVYREGPLTRSALAKRAGRASADVALALERLAAAERVGTDAATGEADPTYRARSFVVPIGAPAGWEAAVLDHVHAFVRAIGQKLQASRTAAEGDTVGGSTYTFAVWADHPLRAEVAGSLKRIRDDLGALRARVRAFNMKEGVPERYEEIVVYAGQSILEREKENGREES